MKPCSTATREIATTKNEPSLLDGLPAMLTVKETARFLRTNVKTVYAEIQARRLRAIRVGRVIRVPRTVLTFMLEQARVSPLGGSHGG
jgi:excisionase family DNA binding protein